MGEINFAGVDDDTLLEALGRKRLGGQLADVSDEDLMAALGQAQAPTAEPVLPLEQPFALSQQLGGQLPQLPGPSELTPGEQAMRARLAEIGQMAGGGIGAAAQPRGAAAETLVPRGTGAATGEMVGGLASLGAGPFAPVAAPFLAGGGAVAGEQVERWLRGEEFMTPEEQARQFGTTALVEAALPVAGGVVRQGARRLTSALTRELAGQAAERTASQLFKAPARELIEESFSMVRQAQIGVRPQQMRNALRTYSDDQIKYLTNEVKKVGGQGELPANLGELFANNMDAIRKGTEPGQPLDFGAMSQIRSVLQKKADRLDPANTRRQTLDNFIDDLDELIDNGIVTRQASEKAPEVRAMLNKARADWAKFRSNEAAESLVQRNIAVRKGFHELNLDGLEESLSRPSGKLAERVVRNLDADPGAKAQMEGLIKNLRKSYPVVQIEPGTFALTMSSDALSKTVRNMFAATARNSRGSQMLERFIIEGKGRITMQQLALAANVGRRSREEQEAEISPVFGRFGF